MDVRSEKPSRRRRRRVGEPPGSIIADPDAPKPVVTAFAYGRDSFVELAVSDLERIPELAGEHEVVWVNVDGLGDAAVLQAVGDAFRLHRLALEDVINVHQRPKVDEYEDHYFIVFRMPAAGERFDTEQVSLFLGERYVLTFQERSGDCFDPVRERIRKGKGRLRRAGADYLAYALLDALIDSYFPVIERYGERVDAIEEELLDHPTTETVSRIHQVKRDLLTLRRVLWPQRDATSFLLREESDLISDETRVHLRDCYDHLVRLLDLVENYRDLGSALMELYMSMVSNRMNEVMKVLTIIATIFIPLTFIAGVYGMNFNPEASPWNMPELNWRYGYPASLALMVLVGGGLYWFFRRKKWL